jgi:hypothetical protein
VEVRRREVNKFLDLHNRASTRPLGAFGVQDFTVNPLATPSTACQGEIIDNHPLSFIEHINSS